MPGLLAVSMYMITIAIIGTAAAGLAAGRPAPARGASGSQALRDVWAPLLLFVFVIGGLYGGLFTPTEAGGMGAGGAFMIGVARGRLSRADILALAAAGDAHRGGGVHRADRRDAVRLFPDRHADAAEGDRVRHRPRASAATAC